MEKRKNKQTEINNIFHVFFLMPIRLLLVFVFFLMRSFREPNDIEMLNVNKQKTQVQNEQATVRSKWNKHSRPAHDTHQIHIQPEQSAVASIVWLFFIALADTLWLINPYIVFLFNAVSVAQVNAFRIPVFFLSK